MGAPNDGIGNESSGADAAADAAAAADAGRIPPLLVLILLKTDIYFRKEKIRNFNKERFKKNGGRRELVGDGEKRAREDR
jgi:hypothetical protein